MKEIIKTLLINTNLNNDMIDIVLSFIKCCNLVDIFSNSKCNLCDCFKCIHHTHILTKYNNNSITDFEKVELCDYCADASTKKCSFCGDITRDCMKLFMNNVCSDCIDTGKLLCNNCDRIISKNGIVADCKYCDNILCIQCIINLLGNTVNEDICKNCLNIKK